MADMQKVMTVTSPPKLDLKDVRLHKVFERRLAEGGTRKHVGHSRPREDPLDDGILTVYQLRDVKGEVKLLAGYLEIVSEFLQQFLRDVLDGYPEPDLNTSPMRFRYPYFSLIHRYQMIEESAAKSFTNGTEKRHLQHLLKFIVEDLRDELKDYNAAKDFSAEVSFRQLWTCFVPGQILVKKDEVHCEECFEIRGIQYTPEMSDNPEFRFFLISARQCQYAKGRLGYSSETEFPIQYFPGTKPISSLDWIPLEARHDWEAFRTTKIREGHEWWRIVSGPPFSHAEYDSVAFTNDQNIFPYRHGPNTHHWRIIEYMIEHKEFKPFHVQGEIMLDQEAFVEANPHRAVLLSTEVSESMTEKEYRLSEQHALIAPARLPGFALQEKIWAYFQISKLREMVWSPEAYQSLQIDKTTKSLLLNLVKSQQIGVSQQGHDLIPGKGNGLIFLLHGSPGTGKTFTAQAMAHYTKRPLYATTSGELSKKDSLERNLRDALRWSRRWQAIFLLDEADVFLAKRTIGTDMKRNETVTIFLQQVEYSSGIMFLSTNRIGDFDPAFLSRIHLAIRYGKLDNLQRRKIWKGCIGNRFKFSEDEFAQLAEAGDQLSGRDIRNIVQMVVQLQKVDDEMDGFQTTMDLVWTRQENLALCLATDNESPEETAKETMN